MNAIIDPNTWVYGILLGGLYAATALGLSLVFGTMRLVNLAHGNFLVVGAFLTSLLVTRFIPGVDPLLAAIPVAIVMALLAYPLQRFVITPVMSRGEEAPITVTFGVGLALATLLVLVFGSDPVALNPAYATATWVLGPLKIRVSLLMASLFAVVVVLLLSFLLKKTPFGRQVRAASIDAEAAGLVGIDVNKTYARVMAISAAVAAFGGVLIALSFGVAPADGNIWLLRAFTVIVIGGLGSLPGTIYGGIIVGLVETVGAVTIGPQYRDVVVFGVLVIILLVRPNGLFTKAVKA